MANKQQVEAAADIARGLLGEVPSVSSPASGLTELVRRFALIEFDVPDSSDSDGYLFQYGEVNWFSEPTFELSLVRQLEVVDLSGRWEAYVQVLFEFRYPLDEDLGSVDSHSEWWFPGNEMPFDLWLDSVDRSPIVGLLSGKTLREFVILQERV
ncbi:hypothetical protein GCM10023085_06240 [Actinomadura viridis]|uniref:Uncharacterized protein n=1 Tax=Actinomadura viridis TaxID=58110 RepID=A0A931GM32_9ACTN|nr:hypothetical protein [Actinomadura viridis]MBG6091640.1 hypothetical protein [Actinomadura viridis]